MVSRKVSFRCDDGNLEYVDQVAGELKVDRSKALNMILYTHRKLLSQPLASMVDFSRVATEEPADRSG